MRRPHVKSVLNWLFNLCLLGGAACVFLFGGLFLPQVSLVNGHSMNPTFQSGDAVITVRADAYATGDIIVYHPENLPCAACNIVHRVTGSEQRHGKTVYFTQGDNNPNPDPWQPAIDEVKGKVLVFLPVRGGARIVYYPQFWLMLIGFFGAGVIAWRLRGLLHERQDGAVSDPKIPESHLNPVTQFGLFDLDTIYSRRTAHLPIAPQNATLDMVYAARTVK